MYTPGFRASFTFFAISLANSVWAQTDEIQVYTGELAARGEFSLTLHNNYTAVGRTTADTPGGVTPGHALNGVPEFAYGVNEWLELGAYVPVYTVTRHGNVYWEGVKLRALLAVPDAGKQRVFYGMNFEYSCNARRWETSRFSGEMRAILGARLGDFDFAVNPILDTKFDRLNRADFAPCGRIAWRVSPRWALAVEHYADFGEIRRFSSSGQQQHSLFAVVDFNGQPNIEFGIGHGVKGPTDSVVVKLMVSWSLNR